jgi:hypothetical protein
MSYIEKQEKKKGQQDKNELYGHCVIGNKLL